MFQAYGKSLISGNYAITEDNVSGISLGLSSSFYAYKKKILPEEQKVTVITPQFNDNYAYKYSYSLDNLNPIQNNFKLENHLGDNIFLENLLKVVFEYLLGSNSLKNKGMQIELFEDKEFLSPNCYRNNHKVQSYVDPKSKYQSFIENISVSQKTGIGSSACFIVSIVGLLVEQLSEKIIQKEIIEVLSLVAYFIATNKIGSGFDIATAVYGTIKFERIPKNDIETLLEIINTNGPSSKFAEKIEDIATKRKMNTNEGFVLKNLFNGINEYKIKDKFKVYLVDFAIGEASVPMVKNVSEYWNKNPEKKKSFLDTSLKITNKIFDSLVKILTLSGDDGDDNKKNYMLEKI